MGHPKLTRKMIGAILQLLIKQPWLEDRYDALEELMSLCSDETQKTLVYTLLGRFNYLEEREFSVILRAIVSTIFETWALPLGQTQIVAVTANEEADGAQVILDSLKSPLMDAGIGHKDVKLVNRVWHAIKDLDKRPNVVLVDDFVGSGKTIQSRVRQLRHDFDMRNHVNGNRIGYHIYACTIACMESARAGVDSVCEQFFAGLYLKKGISGHETGRALFRAYKDMLRLEKRIKDDAAAEEFPFGFGRVEALFALKLRDNIPNSVFPVFWWPRLSDGKSRKTIFRRFERL